jgi:dihydroflavonol-4-reductase
MQNVFVTGGNGFIGARVVKALSEKGYNVKCLLRPTSKTFRINKYKFEKAIGDLRDFNSLVEGMRGADAVIHLASLSSWSDIHSPLMREVVVEGSKNVFKAALQCGIARTVYVSSSTAIDGTHQPILLNEESPFTLPPKKFTYAAAKKEVEGICRSFVAEGLPIVIVNPAEVYGPEDDELITSGNLIDFAKSSPVLVTRGGTSIVHVDDVAAGIIAALNKGKTGERYILGGDNLTVLQLAETTLQILGQKKKIIVLPNGLILFLAALGSNLKVPMPFNPAVIPYAVRFWFLDNTKARKELGISFRNANEVLKPTIEWLKATGRITV